MKPSTTIRMEPKHPTFSTFTTTFPNYFIILYFNGHPRNPGTHDMPLLKAERSIIFNNNIILLYYSTIVRRYILSLIQLCIPTCWKFLISCGGRRWRQSCNKAASCTIPSLYCTSSQLLINNDNNIIIIIILLLSQHWMAIIGIQCCANNTILLQMETKQLPIKQPTINPATPPI